MRKIAACVGIAPSTIYKHYRNKAELLDRVALEETRRLRHRCVTEWRHEHPPRHLVRIVERLVVLSRSEPHLFQLLRDRVVEEGPKDLLAHPLNRISARRRGCFNGDHARRIWAGIVGAASPHAFGALADERYQLTRTLEGLKGPLGAIWHSVASSRREKLTHPDRWAA